MSHRSRASRVRQHVHCDSCYSRRCRARVEVSVCCAVIPCRLHCGALFHLCKEEDHLLLCPNVRVPCLNAEYGCPVHLPRSSQAAHLQVCPASVVCCSMEWNRWPANDSHSYPNTELHENLLREREQGACLDLAMALKDQDCLFHSMKMKKLFPELVQSVEEEEKEEERREKERRKEKQKQRKATLEKEAAERAAAKKAWESFNMFDINTPDEKDNEDEDEVEVEYEQELTQEQREAIARGSGVNADLLENYSAWERMFSMEMGGCRETEGAAVAGKGKELAKGRGKGLDTLTEEDIADTCMGATASNTCKQVSSACIASSTSSSSCLAGNRKKKFVYGHVEPMKIITVRTFKIPTSFSARQGRIRNPGFYRRESQAVDTSDLGVALEEMPVWEEVQASLLCSLEKEQRGHLIAESVCTDGLLQDEGTQTYNFLSAPFRRNTSLADLTTAKPLELHLQLQVESVTSRHHKASSAFTFLCGHTFQRGEYGKHYKNIHSDIQMGVNGWFEQRCPLAYLGCTYSQRRFQPSTHEATVTYNEDLGCFSLHPIIPVSLGDASQPSRSTADSSTPQRKRGGEYSLSSLPYEVLCHMASFLDSLSLSQLALVSRLMRQVCSSLLQERGMVTLRWERKTYSHGGAKWTVKQRVWQFSTLFSPVDTWCFQDVPSISEHLKVCPCYERESRTEKIHLPRIKEEVQTKTSCNGPTLVNLFQQKRIMM
ncbi:F-box only protein 40-like [Siniperca chuatsi]|uniref:F-box only protein 40-like n=1 Tax=Siniperca chuatsi TaxID=119488 RepID=UPI001CE08313|nr:F-box only protein 40-like [Siniperca chuatsi]XP_044079078.1 F-box only protein 40-like [Siniperca chuatsi]XP_044079079.1 F-box only protein 40-like [Siniperca chuatsi]XP_044079080.1 F-box only protein 40-like [Siniperca chuatsi]XP_044079082.1 F-box only protein 40-like [Siniperca chuatsi]